MLAILFGQYERHQSCTCIANLYAELPGDVVAESGGTHLRDGKATCSDDKRCCVKGVFGRPQGETCVACDLSDSRVEKNSYAHVPGFFFQQCDDLTRRAIAKELTERLLVERDAMFFDEGDEV